MEDRLVEIFYLPEFFLTLGTLCVLLIGLFTKEDNYRIISLISIFLLIIVSFLVFKSEITHFAFYNNFFKNSEFISFFKILIIFGSASCIAISINFFNQLKLNKFEIPVLILFSTLGMMILISSNNLMSMYLGIELQSLSLYVLASIQKDSIKSAESGVKYFCTRRFILRNSSLWQFSYLRLYW